MAHEPEHEHDSGRGLALETAKPEVARPPLFQVLLLNDDFTPMDFVVEVLRTFFNLDQEQAVQVMRPSGQRMGSTPSQQVSLMPDGFSTTHSVAPPQRIEL